MKKIVTLCVSLFLLVCGAFPALADDGGFTITNYAVQATLHEDNVVQQTEVIDVCFNAPRHGIYRSIPLTVITQRDGELMEYRAKVEDVSVDGAPYTTSIDDGYYTIRIGDEDETVIGNQQYTISFSYSMPDDRIGTSDFLFHSVLGSEWDTTIDHFSFEMAFDKPLTQEAVERMRLYSGFYGSIDNDLHVAYQVTQNGISGQVDNVRSHQAVTIFGELPEGYFTGERMISSWPAWVMAVLTLLIGGYIIFRVMTTRSAKPVQTVEFYPPDGISSAEVGYIIDRSSDESDLLSLIPWWAEKGYITIEEIPDKKGRTGKHSSLILHKKQELPDSAPAYMKELFQALFGNKETCDMSKLSTKFPENLRTACSLLKDEFVGTRELYTGTAQPIILLLLTCVAFGAMLTLCSSIYWTENIPLAVIAACALFLLGLYMRRHRFTANFQSTGGKIVHIVVLLACLLAAAGCAALCIVDSVLPMVMILIVFFVTAVAIQLASRLIQPTPYNVEITGKLMGLKHFIQTAEMPRLKLLLEENPSYYYDILPYAMVFGLTDQWADQFRELSVMQPDWYIGNNTMFNIWYFNTMMHHGVQQPIQHVQAEAAREAAKSSGMSGGGGGFSGGGGGGGGGGSW